TGGSVGGIERADTSADTLPGLQDNNVDPGIGKPPAASQAARACSYHDDICQHFRTPAGSAFVVLNVLSMISVSIATKMGRYQPGWTSSGPLGNCRRIFFTRSLRSAGLILTRRTVGCW